MHDVKNRKHLVEGAVRVATARLDDTEQAVRSILGQLEWPDLAGAVMFCSTRYDLAAVSAALRECTQDIPIIGCTSAAELTADGPDRGTLTAIGFPKADFSFTTAFIDGLDHFDGAAAQQEVRTAAAKAIETSRRLGGKLNHAALILMDGLSHRDEIITVTVQDALGSIPMVGGLSGDRIAFKDPFVFHDGAFRSNCAVVGIISTVRPLKVFRAQYYVPRDEKMVITRADVGDRIAFELNAEPAALEYARLAGVSVTELGPEVFAAHPPMVRAGGEYYARSIQCANPDNSLTFYCAIDEGIVMTLGESADIVPSLERLFSGLSDNTSGIDKIIGFDCALNSVEVAQRQLTFGVSRVFSQWGVVGFSSYGEQFGSLHVNQTLTGLAIGK
ncbi:FIST N-terminal domain-containing protein [Sphingobium sp. RAC03]|uniref:FIST N-terminal domain-containing protein n=1 Tax=Sphingobium sp. RAC03 TaxID=1843368 RepID=UPI000858C818|nr:FIST N-terminal domain-containing protein [Sphingobium sp. RAC03]AOF98518.1 FIST N domain protein [Sphingobium sp. RAC03]